MVNEMKTNLWSAENVVLQEMLVNCRTDAQLTQKQLSLLLKRPQSYVSKYESGERKLTLPEIREILLCCGSNLSDFVDLYEKELKLVEKNDKSL